MKNLVLLLGVQHSEKQRYLYRDKTTKNYKVIEHVFKGQKRTKVNHYIFEFFSEALKYTERGIK